MKIAGPTRLSRRISLTPLIDVVFLLLIFFMLASTFAQFRKIEFNTGQAGPAAQPIAPGTAVVMLHADGTISLDGTRISLDDLVAKLETRKPPVLIRLEKTVATQRVATQRLVDVLVRVKGARPGKITLAR